MSKKWIILANKAKSVIFHANNNSYEIIKTFENPKITQKSSELFSDRSGTNAKSFRNDQAAVSESHYKEEKEQQFATEILDFVNNNIHNHKLDELTIICEKSFVNSLRNKYSKNLKEILDQEILQNFYTEKSHELDQFLEKL